MRITREQFENYCKKRGKYLGVNNKNRFFNTLGEKIEEVGDSDKLDEYVRTLKKGREMNRKVVVEFYNFIVDEYGLKKPESDLYNKKYYEYPFERQLEIAKYLHIERTAKEIIQEFEIDERTMRKDLQELENGITVLGSKIQIKKEKKGRKYYYKTTLHPVFLPLNLTEVYALTVYLDRVIDEKDPNAKIIKNISQRIKSQLSDYAYSKIFGDEIEFRKENKYIDDKEMATQRSGIYMYLMKSGQNCKFIWNDSEYNGTIIYDGEKYRIKLEDGKILDADLNEVDFIIDSLEYK